MWGSVHGHWYDPWYYPFPNSWDSENDDSSDQGTNGTPDSDWLSDMSETDGEKSAATECITHEWSDHADVEPFVNKTHRCCPFPSDKAMRHFTDVDEDDSSSDCCTSEDDDCDSRYDSDWSNGEDEAWLESRRNRVSPYGKVVSTLCREPRSLSEGMVEETETESIWIEETQAVSVEFPEEIITLILSKLPFHHLCRVRTVCKAWNSLLHDPEFAKICTKTAEVPFCVMFDHYVQGYSTYNPIIHAWRRLPRSFFSFSSPKFCLLACASGILLYEGVGYEQRTFFLVNPINKSERKLPALDDTSDRVYYAHIAMDRETDQFKVLIVDLVEGKPGCSYLKFQVYDSCSKSWEMFGAMPPNLRESDFRGTVLHKGNLYCLAHVRYSYELLCISQQNIKGEKILDSKGGKAFWNSTNIKLPDNEFLFLDLFEYQGQLMVGGRMDDMDHELNLQFWRYELVREKMRWAEVQRLPKKLRTRFSVLEEFALVLVQGDYVWASSVVENYNNRRTVIDGSVMVMSSISEKKWCVIPNYPFGCPSNCNRDYCGEDLGRRACTLFLFEPRMDLLL